MDFFTRKRFSMAHMSGWLGVILLCIGVAANAVTVPNTFQPGSPVSASEMNANFAALQAAVTTLETTVATLGTQVTTLQSQVGSLGPLAQHVTVTEGALNGLPGPHVIFSGVNVHIRNGIPDPTGGAAVDGRGNLIIGHNENSLNSARTGSHNLVMGIDHRYEGKYGVLVGRQNAAMGSGNVVIGVQNSVVRDLDVPDMGFLGGCWGMSVLGGWGNAIEGWYSTAIPGGGSPSCYGDHAVLVGGRANSINPAWGPFPTDLSFAMVIGGHGQTPDTVIDILGSNDDQGEFDVKIGGELGQKGVEIEGDVLTVQ